ncbi:MAG: hypothetical protein ACI4QI_03315, partial [Candidatus Coproplasma sp.]
MSNYDFNKHKKGDKVKWFFTGLAFFLVIVTIVGMCLQLWGTGKVKPSEWFKHEETEETTPETENTELSAGGAIVENVESNGIMLFSEATPLYSSGDDGIATVAALSTYTITATVTPTEATNKSVTGTLSFKNPSSTWATGKTVTDYATVAQSTSGVFTLSVLEAFGEPIILTVTSNENSDISATCQVDYVKRVQSVSLDLSGTNVSSATSNYKLINCEDSFTVGYSVTYGVGTVTGTFTGGAITTTLSTDLYNTCKTATTSGSYTFSQSSTGFISANLSSVTSATVTSKACTYFISVTGDPDTGKSQWAQAFYNYVNNNSSSAHATLTMPYSYSYNGVGSSSGTASRGVLFRASS